MNKVINRCYYLLGTQKQFLYAQHTTFYYFPANKIKYTHMIKTNILSKEEDYFLNSLFFSNVIHKISNQIVFFGCLQAKPQK